MATRSQAREHSRIEDGVGNVQLGHRPVAHKKRLLVLLVGVFREEPEHIPPAALVLYKRGLTIGVLDDTRGVTNVQIGRLSNRSLLT